MKKFKYLDDLSRNKSLENKKNCFRIFSIGYVTLLKKNIVDNHTTGNIRRLFLLVECGSQFIYS